MNEYIKEILSERDEVLRQKKIQKIVNDLINVYSKSETENPSKKTNKPLKYIKEIVNFFKSKKINLRKNNDVLLRIASLDGETDFIKWLLKEAVCKSVPDVTTNLSAPLRFACVNGHEELVQFLLTDKEIERSHINVVNGGALGAAIAQKNMNVVKLLLSQPEINIQIEHIRGIFRWNEKEQREILNFILNNKVKEVFFIRMVQYQSEMNHQIKELITDYKVEFTSEMISSVKYKQEISELINKKQFLNKLQSKLPNKGNRPIMNKI